jgi:hypothetical protein
MSQEFLNKFLVAIKMVEPFQEKFDLSYWQNLTLEEKNVATEALLEAAELGNPRALMTLGDLGDEKFIDTIKKQIESPGEWVRLCANRALLKLGVSTEGLLSSISEGTMLSRFASVMDLSSIPGEKIDNALLDALEDTNPYVRSIAMDALIERFGLIALTKNQEGKTILESPLMTINTLLMADLNPLWKKGAWEARQIFSSLKEGALPTDLNLRYVQNGADNFRQMVRDAFFDDQKPFDTGLIGKVKGHDRFWAETFLSLQLQTEIRNPRAVEALSELKAKWVVPALEASCIGVPKTDPYFILAQEAISELSK